MPPCAVARRPDLTIREANERGSVAIRQGARGQYAEREGTHDSKVVKRAPAPSRGRVANGPAYFFVENRPEGSSRPFSL